ncbi:MULTISPECIES: (deoxy)nucleoside triphosphate pyrophosphohydrolase [unclassified Psychrobacter]|uniref:(deoxy)nucleoside triphosphate pyrophosphohydrolase n=1 Tax=unclassified Psychrobacter TaxID=196806 RepID=UPI003FD2C25F
MTEPSLKPKSTAHNSINVAIAVIYYQNWYLLGYRHSKQHQGNLYEFVGGKIEVDETAKAALVREVGEEVGIDISQNTMMKMGLITHDYADKQVILHAYTITLTAAQYAQHKNQKTGLEGQLLSWVTKDQLLGTDYPLPAANKQILTWLRGINI